jgi:hypothetical protein
LKEERGIKVKRKKEKESGCKENGREISLNIWTISFYTLRE